MAILLPLQQAAQLIPFTLALRFLLFELSSQLVKKKLLDCCFLLEREVVRIGNWYVSGNGFETVSSFRLAVHAHQFRYIKPPASLGVLLRGNPTCLDMFEYGRLSHAGEFRRLFQ